MTTHKITEFQAYNLTKSGKKFTAYGATPREAANTLLAVMAFNRSRAKEIRVTEGEREGPFFVTRMAISAYSTSGNRSWKVPAHQGGVEQLPEA